MPTGSTWSRTRKSRARRLWPRHLMAGGYSRLGCGSSSWISKAASMVVKCNVHGIEHLIQTRDIHLTLAICTLSAQLENSGDQLVWHLLLVLGPCISVLKLAQ